MKGRARREKKREREKEREVENPSGARRRTGVLAMLSTLEGELPRTRGPNPLFWTHTLAHLSLTPNHLQLTLSPHLFPAPFPVYPCRTYCRLSCLLRYSDSFSNGKHGTLPGVLRCCLARRPSSPLQSLLRSRQPSSTFNFV